MIRQWNVENALIFERYLGVQYQYKTPVNRCLTGTEVLRLLGHSCALYTMQI